MSDTRIIELRDGPPDIGQVMEVVQVLESGGVAALPTETVYGLCCRANSKAAAEQIYALKRRPSDKPLPYLIPDFESVGTFVNRVPKTATKLMDRFWPGPLTLVLGPGEGIALRMPDHDFLREVLRRAGGPVHGTSANLSGEKPATTVRRIQRFFPVGLGLIVDGGKSRLGVESSIVRVPDQGPTEIVRAGQLGEETIRSTVAKTILLVCTGNTCRSPMAAAALKATLAWHLRVDPERLEQAGYRVVSAGVSAFPGMPMTRDAEDALRAEGIPVGPHVATPLTSQMLRQADVVFGMTHQHAAAIRAKGESAASVHLFDPSGQDIADPIGGSPSTYRACLKELRSVIDQRLRSLLD